MIIFVANLAWSITDEDLRALFSPFGEVRTANVILDHETGASRGFGFCEMPNAVEAANAIVTLDGTLLKGRTLHVERARERRGS